MSALQEREADIMRREAETGLRDRHPDFETIRTDENFHEWAKVQPEEIQDWIYKNPDNISLASKAIDLYKMDSGVASTSRRRQSQQPREGSAADMVSTKTTTVDVDRGTKIWTEREIDAMSLDEFDAREDEINQALTEGRVVQS